MHGVMSKAELELQGLTKRKIAELVNKGALKHVSRGWYAWQNADPKVVLAASVHTRIGCLTACAMHGLWVPPQPASIHMTVNEWDSPAKIRKAISATLIRSVDISIHRFNGDKSELVASPKEALEHVARFHEPEVAMIEIESALNLNLVTVECVMAMLERLPSSRARFLRAFQTTSQSGSETRVAHFLRSRGLTVIQQFSPFPNRWVDMKVGESWIVECDSAAHHAGETAYESDRQRDLALKAMGYEVTRLSYRQIWLDWDNTRRMLEQIIRQRRYLRKVKGWRSVFLGVADPTSANADFGKVRQVIQRKTQRLGP
ncbi:endonuclease domain-containing protein [Trueperella pyogenes]